jgi:hypothetical protein
MPGDIERFEEISRDGFFKKFEENQPAFLCPDNTRSGALSKFRKFATSRIKNREVARFIINELLRV